MAVDESNFATRADRTLSRLAEVIEEILGDRLDVELNAGVLTIELESGGQYVINKHAPTRQIWLSSPVSGASHFDFREGAGWVATKTEARLEPMLADELAAATGTRIAFD
jgi:frataxin